MVRVILDTELDELNAKVVQLGSLVDIALEKALSALQQNDLATCGLVIASDEFIDELRNAIDQHSFRLLTLQQPLGNRDLRFLTSVVSIAGDLERIGDGAAGIAQMLLRMEPLRDSAKSTINKIQPATMAEQKRAPSFSSITESSLLQGMLDLGQEARRVLQGTMSAFAERDVKAARYIWEEDDVVDVRYHMLRHEMMTMLSGMHAIPALQQDEMVLQRVTYYLWMAHKLERVADHCTNICERTVFILEGDPTITPSEDL